MKAPCTVTKSPRMLAATVFGALALSFGVVSLADNNADVPQTIVMFEDLNISSPPGAAALYSRIVSAAQQVCQPYDTDTDNLDLESYSVHKTCVHDAILHAVNKVSGRELFLIYNAKNTRRH